MAWRYDPPSGRYTSAIPPGTAAFRQALHELYPGIRTEVVRDAHRCAGQRSEHCDGRAVDVFTDVQDVRRDVFDRVVSTAAALGFQSVIADRRVWGFGRWQESAYTGPHPHDDHVHIGLTYHAAATLSRARVLDVWRNEGVGWMAQMTDAQLAAFLRRVQNLEAAAGAQRAHLRNIEGVWARIDRAAAQAGGWPAIMAGLASRGTGGSAEG